MDPPLLYPPATPTEIYKSAPALIEFSLAMRYATDVGGMSERDGCMSHDPAMTVQAWGKKNGKISSLLFIFLYDWMTLADFGNNPSSLVSYWLFLWPPKFFLGSECFLGWPQKPTLVFDCNFILAFSEQDMFLFFIFGSSTWMERSLMHIRPNSFCSCVAQASNVPFCITNYFYITIHSFDREGRPLLWAKRRIGEFAIYDGMVKVRHNELKFCCTSIKYQPVQHLIVASYSEYCL